MLQDDSSPPVGRPHPNARGRWTVVGMLAFGLLMVSALWVYWELYTRPFRSLQVAIAKQYPHSSPRVIGGRPKSHLPDSPSILRVIVSIPVEEFNPEEDVARSERRAAELARLTAKLQDLSPYDELEIHLVQRLPEQASRHWSVSKSIAEWQSTPEL
jgi:hypothetical protein